MSAHTQRAESPEVPRDHQAQYDKCVEIAEGLEQIRSARQGSEKVSDAISDIKEFLRLNWTKINLESLSEILEFIKQTIENIRLGEPTAAGIVESLPTSSKLLNLIRAVPAHDITLIRLPRKMLDKALHKICRARNGSKQFEAMRKAIQADPILHGRWRELLPATQQRIIEDLAALLERIERRRQMQTARKNDKGQVQKPKHKRELLPEVSVLTPEMLLGDAATLESQLSALAQLHELAEADALRSPFDERLQLPTQRRPSSLSTANYAGEGSGRSLSPNAAFQAIARDALYPTSDTSHGTFHPTADIPAGDHPAGYPPSNHPPRYQTPHSRP